MSFTFHHGFEEMERRRGDCRKVLSDRCLARCAETGFRGFAGNDGEIFRNPFSEHGECAENGSFVSFPCNDDCGTAFCENCAHGIGYGECRGRKFRFNPAEPGALFGECAETPFVREGGFFVLE